MVTAVGTVVALCIMGDSLMYSILPLYAPTIGIALPLVGVLLSANRFVRLLSNRWAGSAFERFGARLPFLFSVVLGLASTIAYAPATGFIVFLIARLAWGVAWSGLRQGGYVATWYGRPEVRGRLTGLQLGLIRLGSAVGVVLGGFLYDRYGFVIAIAVIAAIGALAVPLTLQLPWRGPAGRAMPDAKPAEPAAERHSSADWRTFAQAAFAQADHRWLSLSSFFTYLLSGVIVSTTSVFVAARAVQLSSENTNVLAFGIGVATLTGLLHGMRWVTNILIGPLVGALSDRFGKSNTLLAMGALMLAVVMAIAIVPAQFAILLLLVVLLLDGSLHVVVNAAAVTIATDTERPHTFVAAFATLSDAGSAFGPLIAFSALATTRLSTVYVTGAVVLLFCLFNYWRVDPREPVAA